MSRVEVVVEFGIYTSGALRFRQWLFGWLQYNGYNVVGTVTMDDDYYTVFEVEGDLFELFGRLFNEVRFVRRHLKADVVVGLCSGGECIDLVDEFGPKMVLSNYALKKLNRVVNKVRYIVGDDNVRDISFIGGDGIITVVAKGCATDLYVNEAFVVAADLIEAVRHVTKLKILDEVYDVYKVFDSEEVKGIDVSFMTDEDGHITLYVGECSKLLTAIEALRVAYWLMYMALWQLKMWKEEEEKKEGYE